MTCPESNDSGKSLQFHGSNSPINFCCRRNEITNPQGSSVRRVVLWVYEEDMAWIEGTTPARDANGYRWRMAALV
jgi:hypothetical protein